MMHYRQSLIKLLAPLDPEYGAEIGVHKGKTSEMLLQNFPKLKLLMIDPYINSSEYPHQEQYKEIARQKTERFGGRAVYDYKTSVLASEELRSNSLHFAFVDASHRYSDVCNDLAVFYPKIMEGGIFCGHDYGKEDYPGVKKAVDEWCAIMGFKINVTDGHIWWIAK